MEFISGKEIQGLVNPGVVSRQLLNPENSQSQRMTLTEVHLEPGPASRATATRPPSRCGMPWRDRGPCCWERGRPCPSAGEMWFGLFRERYMACKTLGWRSLCI